MKTRFTLFLMLGLLTALLTLNDLPLFPIHHAVSLAYAANPDNNGNHYGNDNNNGNHYGNDNNNGNHYAYGQSGGNNQDPLVAVPEPSTFLLFSAGLAGVGFLRRRLKK